MSEPGTTAVDVVATMAERFAAGDFEGAFAVLHPTFRIQQPESLPHGGWYDGREGMGQMGARFAEHWTRTISPPHLAAWGEGAVQVTTQTWTATATGRSATVDVVELFEVTDGQISQIRVFQQDTALLLATLP